jgi:hypothetical protein
MILKLTNLLIKVYANMFVHVSVSVWAYVLKFLERSISHLQSRFFAVC